jgi:hypothetical protein
MKKIPCECIERSPDGYWVCDCGCSNSGDYGHAMAWCADANARGCFMGLYNSEINFSVSCFWAGGFDVKLGDAMNGWLAQTTLSKWEEVSPWLAVQAVEHFPNSVFAQTARQVSV